MDELGWVEIVDALEELIENVDLMHFLQNIGADHRMQISLHELKNKI